MSVWGCKMVEATTSKLNHGCAGANMFLNVGETSLTPISMLDIELEEELLTNYKGAYF